MMGIADDNKAYSNVKDFRLENIRKETLTMPS